MGADYEIGVGVVGQRVALAMRREGRVRFIAWETAATHAHAAALEGVFRACSEPLAHNEARRVFLRQRSVVQACGNDDGIAAILMESRATVEWSSVKAPNGEHEMVTMAVTRAANGVTAT